MTNTKPVVKSVWPKISLLLRRAALALVLTLAAIIPSTSPTTTSALSVPGLAVGSYNILGYYHQPGATRYEPARLRQIVANINDMRLDVVGLQEYRDQGRGDPKALEHELQKLNPAWRMVYNEHGVQLNMVYNSNTVRLLKDRAIKTFDNPSCTGGTPYVRVANFQTVNGSQEFLFINLHTNSQHGGSGSTCSESTSNSERLRVVRSTLEESVVRDFTGPVLFVGDFNARPDKPSASNYDPGVENYLESNGYANARDIPNANRKRGGNIDHIYYKKATVTAPAYFESLDCKPIPRGVPAMFDTSMTCASDHVPIKAIFSNLNGSGSGCGSVSSLNAGRKTQFEEWDITFYDPSISACCIATVSNGELVGETNAEKAYNFLVTTPISTNANRPLTAAQAAGAVGNLMRESAGDTYSLKTDASNGTHFGIAQWGARFAALKNFAEAKGTEWTDLKTQLEFIIYELENEESAVIKDSDFKNAPNSEAGARLAAVRWDKFYERSGGNGLDKRQDNAARAFNDFSNNTGSSSTTDEEADPGRGDVPANDDEAQALSYSSNDSAGCAATSSDYVFPLKATKVDVRKWGNNPGDTEWRSGRYHENVFTGYFAVDIMAPEGTPVVAFRGGEVIDVSVGSRSELRVQIKDSDGYTYFYTHLSRSRGASVKKNDKVEAGTVIAYIGNRQEAWGTSPHLHIDKSKNPGEGLRGSCTASQGYCPIASEDRFVRIVKELHDSYEKLGELPTTTTSPGDQL